MACEARKGVGAGWCSWFSSNTVSPTSASVRLTRQGKPGLRSATVRTMFCASNASSESEKSGAKVSSDRGTIRKGIQQAPISTKGGDSFQDRLATDDPILALESTGRKASLRTPHTTDASRAEKDGYRACELREAMVRFVGYRDLAELVA